ncbi:methyltransferase [Actinomadura roseirufa]|uniref:methyltransferase n=1 Tax=Actinomadura roseirufa TaxID=2094049 RepID=UPI0010411341|nr:methyltransferase [Actinomadura roseirufa]
MEFIPDLAPDPSSAPSSAVTGMTREDGRRIRDAIDQLASQTLEEALTDVLPQGIEPELVKLLTRRCTIDHGSCLVFASDLDGVTAYLRRRGCLPGEPIASTVVRDRLAARYRVPPPRVTIVHAALAAVPDRGLEVFCAAPEDLPASAPRDERLREHEYHLAVRLTRADGANLEHLRRELAGRLPGLRPDGGGYNPDHGESGCTVLYYRAEGRTTRGRPRRLEIITAGHHPLPLERHLAGGVELVGLPPSRVTLLAERADATGGSPNGVSAGTPDRADDDAIVPNDHDDLDDPDDQEGRALLRRLTGAWVAQALRVMVELDLPDHLAAGPLTADELAGRTRTDPALLRRLLRALNHPWIGAVRVSGATVELTPLGRRLGRRHPRGMRNLALLYGDLFYTSFGALIDGVRGHNPFTTVFGQPPFEYLADHPHQGGIFTRAMAEGSVFFGDIASAVDLTAARTICDIGGGNAELLARLLTAYPGLHGTLLERPDVIGAARANLDSHRLTSRCTLVPGSFDDGDVPPGRDVYVLSRILHDWDDRTCTALLRSIRTVARADSSLLIVERPLPDDPGDSSVASLWDLNMLCNNVGGRERTRGEYQRLLRNAGWLLTGERHLSLDFSVLMACPDAPDPTAESSLPAGLFKYAR